MIPARILTLVAAASAGLVLTSCACDRYSYVTPEETKPQMEAQSRIYGDPDGPARQTQNQYPADPDQATKSAVLKVRLYEDDPYNYAGQQGRRIDTARAVASTRE